MHETGARGGSRLGDSLGALGLNCVEGLGAALGEDADQIDHDMRITQRRLDRGRVAQVGLDDMDLPDPPRGLEVSG